MLQNTSIWKMRRNVVSYNIFYFVSFLRLSSGLTTRVERLSIPTCLMFSLLQLLSGPKVPEGVSLMTTII